MVRGGFAGVDLRLAVARAATFFFAALVLVRFGIDRFDALAFFALRFAVFLGAAFREAVFRLGDLFAMTRML